MGEASVFAKHALRAAERQQVYLLAGPMLGRRQAPMDGFTAGLRGNDGVHFGDKLSYA